MGKYQFYLLALICFLGIDSIFFAQTGEIQSGIFTSDTIQSEILKEVRTLSVYLPPDYSTSGLSYPVLFLLDGKEHIFHTAGVVEYLVSVGRIPEIIIVGIHSTNRYRDYTPDKLEHHAGTGEAKNFTRFLTDELFNFVEHKYRTRKYRMIFGHSYGGSYVLNLLLTNSQLFGSYIAASPNLFIIKNVETKTENFSNKPRHGLHTLCMTVGEQEKSFIKKISIFNEILEGIPEGELEWKSDILTNENHSSTPHKTIYAALEFTFRQFGQFSDDTDKNKIKEQFAFLSKKLGYEVKIPLPVLINLGNSALSSEKLDQAKSIFELVVELYPESEWGYVSLGSVFYTNKNFLKAKEFFQKALKLNPGNQYTQDMLREIDK